MKNQNNHITFILIFIFTSLSLAAEIFIDNLLADDCIGTYSIANRDNSGSDGDAYNTAQEGADVAEPGDIIYFREGTYYNTESTAQRDPVMSILKSGTLDSPITFKDYNNEEVILSAADSNGDPYKFNAISLGIKPSDQSDSSGQGVQNIFINGLIVEDASRSGLSIYGPANKNASAKNPTENVTIRRLIARNNVGGNASGGGINSNGKLVNIIIEYCEVYNNTGSGIGFGRISKTWHEHEPEDDMSAAQNCVIRNCLSYHNIHPEYPGNSDGLVGSHMYKCTFENNVTFGNSDDGFDIYASIETTVKSNICFGHSYEGGNNAGVKFSAGGGGRHHIVANIVFNNDSYSFEGSNPSNPLRIYYPSRLINNTAYKGSVGFSLGNNYTTSPGFEKTYLRNNIALDNVSHDISGEHTDWTDSDYNFILNSADLTDMQNIGQDTNSLTSDPQLVNKEAVIDTIFNPSWSIEEKLEHIRSQVKVAFSMLKESILIDAGIKIDGYHNTNPGDSTGEDGIVWYGDAPDIGAYEYTGNVGIIDFNKNKNVEKYGFKVKSQSSNVIISYVTDKTSNVNILIYNLIGRQLVELVYHLSSGNNNIIWDGYSDSGNPIGAGYYIIRLQDDEQVFLRRFVKYR